MGFMKLTTMGPCSWYYTADGTLVPQSAATTGDVLAMEKCYGARYSAPGYLDATDWSVSETLASAIEIAVSTYEPFDGYADAVGTVARTVAAMAWIDHIAANGRDIMGMEVLSAFDAEGPEVPAEFLLWAADVVDSWSEADEFIEAADDLEEMMHRVAMVAAGTGAYDRSEYDYLRNVPLRDAALPPWSED